MDVHVDSQFETQKTQYSEIKWPDRAIGELHLNWGRPVHNPRQELMIGCNSLMKSPFARPAVGGVAILYSAIVYKYCQ